MFSMLFAIIGDAFADIKEGFCDVPTVLADLKKAMAFSKQSVARFKSAPKRRAHTLLERCGFLFLIHVSFVKDNPLYYAGFRQRQNPRYSRGRGRFVGVQLWIGRLGTPMQAPGEWLLSVHNLLLQEH